MPQEAERSATWAGRIAWVLLAGLVAMAAVALSESRQSVMPLGSSAWMPGRPAGAAAPGRARRPLSGASILGGRYNERRPMWESMLSF